MKSLIPFLFCLGLFLGACNPDKPKTSDNKIIIGTIDSIHSNILNEEEKIWVYTPDNNDYARQKYPVVYLLDGDAQNYEKSIALNPQNENAKNMIKKMKEKSH